MRIVSRLNIFKLPTIKRYRMLLVVNLSLRYNARNRELRRIRL